GWIGGAALLGDVGGGIDPVVPGGPLPGGVPGGGEDAPALDVGGNVENVALLVEEGGGGGGRRGAPRGGGGARGRPRPQGRVRPPLPLEVGIGPNGDDGRVSGGGSRR